MLARVNRLISGEDFRRVARRGRRTHSGHLVVTSLATDHSEPARFGFTMTKSIGNAVVRNSIRRRLRAIAREAVDGGVRGVDVVVRGLTEAPSADWKTLHTEFTAAIKKGAQQ